MNSEVIKDIVGKTITKIERVYYQLKGEVNKEKGPLQISLADQSIVLFDVAEDAETLSVTNKKWGDCFQEPLSEENQEYVDAYGKWEIFDVSGDDEYKEIINKKINCVRFIKADYNIIVGIVLSVDKTLVNIVTGADELWVMFGDCEDHLNERNCIIIKNIE